MAEREHWVLLAYRLPREPSSPRITLWRKLQRLGAAQVVDGLVALPLNPHTREQLEWLAQDVQEAHGEAIVWLAQPSSQAEGMALETALSVSIADEYRAVIVEAQAALAEAGSTRKRVLSRLRREMQRIRLRDYFPPPERAKAEAALDELAGVIEVER